MGVSILNGYFLILQPCSCSISIACNLTNISVQALFHWILDSFWVANPPFLSPSQLTHHPSNSHRDSLRPHWSGRVKDASLMPLWQCCQVVRQDNSEFYCRFRGCGFAVHGARRNASITTRSRFPAWSRTVGFDSRDCFAHYMAVARTKERTLFCAFLLVFCMSHSHAGTIVASEKRTSALYP